MEKIYIFIVAYILFIIGIFILIFKKNQRIFNNLIHSFLSVCVLFYFYYVFTTIMSALDSSIRFDRDVGDDTVIIPIYKNLPIVLFSVLSLLHIIILCILFLKDGISNPGVLVNFFLKSTFTLIILNIMLYLLKRGYHFTLWIIGLIPILLIVGILFYKIMKMVYK